MKTNELTQNVNLVSWAFVYCLKWFAFWDNNYFLYFLSQRLSTFRVMSTTLKSFRELKQDGKSLENDQKSILVVPMTRRRSMPFTILKIINFLRLILLLFARFRCPRRDRRCRNLHWRCAIPLKNGLNVFERIQIWRCRQWHLRKWFIDARVVLQQRKLKICHIGQEVVADRSDLVVTKIDPRQLC